MGPLQVHPIATDIFHRNDNLFAFVEKAIPPHLIHEDILVAVTTKIVSLAENRLVARRGTEKAELIRDEADLWLGEIGHGCILTVKEGLLLASAGIDESNSEDGDYILFPQHPYASAENLRRHLMKAWGLTRLGVMLTDSRTSPLRRGVTGTCLSFAGFRALKNLVGTKDLFGRELRMTQMNLADGLAAAAVMMMGEGSESQPLALIENARVEYTDASDSGDLSISWEEDLYFPMLNAFIKS